MSASDRPTPIGEFHYRDTIEAPPPGYDIDAPGEDTGHSKTILPAATMWPESETT